MNMNRAERLRARRLALKLTMREVSQEIGVTIGGVQKMELAGGLPGLEVGVKLAKLYRRSVQWIIDGTGVISDLVPIVGTTDEGPEPEWNTPEYTPKRGWIPLKSDVFQLFGLKITNANSSSRYIPGDVLLLSLEKKLKRGNDVLISTPDRLLFGVLIRDSDDDVLIDELDNGQRLVIPREKVSGIWEIIGSVNANTISDSMDV